MEKQLVPEAVLARADKILFITNLAIGDFLYWQTHFKAFHAAYPHIKIHVWVDEIRRTWKWWKWKGLKRYSLYDWLRECAFIEKIYDKTYSPATLVSSLKEARAEGYPVIVSIANLRPHRYALLGRLMGPKAFVAGLRGRIGWKGLNLWQRLMYKVLDASSPLQVKDLAPDHHITDRYAAWFNNFFGIQTEAAACRAVVEVPRQWRTNAKLTFLKWGIPRHAQAVGYRARTVFINIFAKDKKRCWPLEAALDLIAMLRSQDYFADAHFIFNTMPGQLKAMQRALRENEVGNVILFSAHEHFFQLPALIEQCDLVISVETAVMHLAAALKVPVVALMRTKNPEWVPWDKEYAYVLMAAKRSDWVKNIPPTQVVHAVNAFLREGVHTVAAS